MSSQESKPTDATAQENSVSQVIVSVPNGLGIRRFEQRDIQSMVRHGNNKKVWDNLRNRMPHPYKESDSKEYIDRCTNADNFVGSGPWTPETGSQGPKVPNNYAITVHDEAVGSIGLDFGDPTDVTARCAEVGYWLSEEHWGKGVMTAIFPAFVEWIWRTFGILLRLEGQTFEWNVASRRILERVGFRLEAVQKWGHMKNGKVGDNCILAMTRPGVKDPNA